MHMPPRVIVLMSIPRKCRTMMVASRDIGMAMIEMTVVLKLPRNRKRIMMTNTAPSSRALPTLPTEACMKSACWNMCVSILTSAGTDAATSLRLASMALVTLRVLMLGCLLMETMTAGLPFCDAVPSLTAGPMRRVATSERQTGPLLSRHTRLLPSSSRSVVRAMPLRAYSLPHSRTIPPSVLMLSERPTASSSAIVTP